MTCWQGKKPYAETKYLLDNGELVESYGGVFVARRLSNGQVEEKCIAAHTWSTRYASTIDYLKSLAVEL